jgi:hypothetical protein
MGRRLSVLALALLAVLPACGGAGTPGAIRPHSPATERAVRSPRPAEPPPRLIAPPPAYGNKIVMARGDRDDSVN